MKEIGIETIVNYICANKEFEFLEEVAKIYHIDFDNLCDFSLIRYTYYKKHNLDSLGAKIISLGETIDYATACYRTRRITKIKENLNNQSI